MRVYPFGIAVSLYHFHCNQLKSHKPYHKPTTYDMPLLKGWDKSTGFNGL